MEVSEAELEALHQTTRSLERPMQGPIPDANIFHAYDPLPWAEFLQGLHHAAPLAPGRRFLDVGCGLGTKVAFMNYLGWQAAGIDRHAPYLDYARRVVPDAEFVLADAFDVASFDADLVFMYRPCVAEKLQARLEAHVSERMAAGSVLWLPTRPDPVRVI